MLRVNKNRWEDALHDISIISEEYHEEVVQHYKTLIELSLGSKILSSGIDFIPKQKLKDFMQIEYLQAIELTIVIITRIGKRNSYHEIKSFLQGDLRQLHSQKNLFVIIESEAGFDEAVPHLVFEENYPLVLTQKCQHVAYNQKASLQRIFLEFFRKARDKEAIKKSNQIIKKHEMIAFIMNGSNRRLIFHLLYEDDMYPLEISQRLNKYYSSILRTLKVMEDRGVLVSIASNYTYKKKYTLSKLARTIEKNEIRR